jgi:hypothetical protein
MFTRIKSVWYFVKEYPKLSLVIIVLVLIVGRMFYDNYSFQQPVVNKRSESYQDVFNGRADCLTQLQEAQNSTNNQ